MSYPMYTSLEAVKRAHNINTPDKDALVFSMIGAASRKIENLVGVRVFIPYLAVKYYPWPPYETTSSFRLWLDNDLAEIPTEVLLRAQDTNPVVLPSNAFFLEPFNRAPPYRFLEIDIRQGYYFGGGLTWQRTVGITGKWGAANITQSAGTLNGNINSSVTALNVSDSSLIGVGDTLLIDSEQLFVTDKGNYNTGLFNMDALTADVDNDTINASGSTIHNYERIIIDNEEMFVKSISGNIITVIRAYNGSTLSAHNESSTIYVPRSLTVTRAVGGTTAASHTSGVAISIYKAPDDIEELCIAETVTSLMEVESGYGRWVGSQHAQREYSGRAIETLREQVKDQYYIRKVRAI